MTINTNLVFLIKNNKKFSHIFQHIILNIYIYNQHQWSMSSAPCFNTKTVFSGIGITIYKDKAVIRMSDLYNGNPYTGKTSLYCNSPLVAIARATILVPNHVVKSTTCTNLKMKSIGALSSNEIQWLDLQIGQDSSLGKTCHSDIRY